MSHYNLRKQIKPSIKAQEAQLKMNRPNEIEEGNRNVEEQKNDDSLGLHGNIHEEEQNNGGSLLGINNMASGDNIARSIQTSPIRTQSTNVEHLILTLVQNFEEFKHDMERLIHNEMRLIERKFTQQIEELREEMQDKITQIHQKIDQNIEAKVKNAGADKRIGLRVTCPTNRFKELPKFNGKLKNPMEYLSKLKNYYRRENEKRISYGEDDLDLEEMFDNCLEGTAATWWNMIRYSVTDFEDFEQIFINKYWNEEIQDGIKRKLDLETFVPRRGLSRAEYFIERVVVLQNMTPKLTEREIVRRLVRHFDGTVQQACRVQNITTILRMEEVLNREDTEETNESIRRGLERNMNRNETQYNKPLRRNDDRKENPQRYFDYNRRPDERNRRYDENRRYNDESNRIKDDRPNWRSNPGNQQRNPTPKEDLN